MPKFIPVQYHSKQYPTHIKPKLSEIAGHFDVRPLRPTGMYCLHTEYSAGQRDFTQPALKDLDCIKTSQRNGVPQLWNGKQWAAEFCQYVTRLCHDHPAPSVIEIHPPFADYCHTLEKFVDNYIPFEEAMREHFPDVRIVIENRHGTRYSGGKFILNKRDDMLALSKIIDSEELHLRLCLDVPQLFTAHFGPTPRATGGIDRTLLPLQDCQHNIDSIHLWGKKPNRTGNMQAHYGTLDTWIGSSEIKAHFLSCLHDLLDDGKERLFIPEVNSSNEDLQAIVNDIEQAGFHFV
jgi:hypothetical protein